jgi:N-acetylmuramoyl-L-alanine amidase
MKRLFALVLVATVAGCATGPRMDTTYTAVSQDSRAQFLILHFTASTLPAALAALAFGPVSSHYLVNDDPPTVYRLVDESRRAWHAGDSAWAGWTQLNAASIGIEIVNTGPAMTPDGPEWPDYPEAQVDAVVGLVKDIVKRHGIRPDRVLGHSDIAPQRKVDPGPKFPWKRLADEGLIAWPDAARVAERRAAYEAKLPDVAWFQARLAAHGYAVPRSGELDRATQRVLAAFQMKYRQDLYDGVPDAETAALLDALTSASPPPASADAY